MSIVSEKYLSKIGAKSQSYAFRGQKDNNWQLHSAATRRLIKYFDNEEEVLKSSRFADVYLVYHRVVLIDPARTNGFGIEDGRTMSDLQLLAKLQHFGAATGLIDFTWDPLVALWFACQSTVDEQGHESSGRVFAIDLKNRMRFSRVSNEEVEQVVERLLSPSETSPHQSFYEPMILGDAERRLLRQHSVFVVERPFIPEDLAKAIDIDSKDKKEMLEELDKLFGINQNSLFADVQGFSVVNGAKSILKDLESPISYLVQGNRFYEQGEFESAISSYDRCINLDSTISEPYFLRGNAKSEKGDYPGAVKDYDWAIRNKERPFHDSVEGLQRPFGPHYLWQLFFNRGNGKAELKDYAGAVRDYDEAIELCNSALVRRPDLYFNRGNANVMRFFLEDALNDYERAASYGYLPAQFNRGNVFVMMGRFMEALQCYEQVGQSGYEHRDQLINNWANVKFLQEEIGDSDYRVHSPSCDIHSRLLTIEVETSAPANRRRPFTPAFGGFTGNSGNVGGEGLPGGRGYKVKNEFIVRLSQFNTHAA
ncbi:MAG: FRG domain-containing protein [Caldilineaceae bacterium]|nr:FRG domain-containing protein [Caldilineaceae bacterium]